MLSSGRYLVPIDSAMSACFINFCNKNKCLLIAIKTFLMVCKLLASILTVFAYTCF